MATSQGHPRRRPEAHWSRGWVGGPERRHGLIIVLVIVGATALLALAFLPWPIVLVATPMCALLMLGWTMEDWARSILRRLRGTGADGEAMDDPPSWRRILRHVSIVGGATVFVGMAASGMLDLPVIPVLAIVLGIVLAVHGVSEGWFKPPWLGRGSSGSGQGSAAPTITGAAARRGQETLRR